VSFRWLFKISAFSKDLWYERIILRVIQASCILHDSILIRERKVYVILKIKYLPTTNNTTIATFADDTSLLATNSDPALAFQELQYHLDLLQEWCDEWKIKINQTKSSQINFTTKRTNCPPVTINNIQIPVQKEVKYLGLYLDQS
jgi:hypothetical protein